MNTPKWRSRHWRNHIVHDDPDCYQLEGTDKVHRIDDEEVLEGTDIRKCSTCHDDVVSLNGQADPDWGPLRSLKEAANE